MSASQPPSPVSKDAPQDRRSRQLPEISWRLNVRSLLIATAALAVTFTVLRFLGFNVFPILLAAFVRIAPPVVFGSLAWHSAGRHRVFFAGTAAAALLGALGGGLPLAGYQPAAGLVMAMASLPIYLVCGWLAVAAGDISRRRRWDRED